jgi:anaerobic selenocysteine-containing dehydrogenase
MSRRAFLGISAAAAAALTAIMVIKRPKASESADKGSERAVETEELVATSCLNCPTRCAITVRVVNGKAVRILGNSNSPYSDGKTCPRSHIGLQVLYNPDRFMTPLARAPGRDKGNGVDLGRDFEPISWGEAVGRIAQKLEGISPERLLILQGLTANSDEDLIRQFAAAYGTSTLFLEESLETAAEREGKRMADGRHNSGYELRSQKGTGTRYILSFGAGIVESERPLARNLRLWGVLRREMPNRSRVVVFDPRYSVTAAKADQWVPINPGTEGAMAMAMASVIISEGLYDSDFVNSHTSGFEGFRTLATSHRFSPEEVAEITGVDAEVIRQTARDFARTRPSIAWIGEAAASWPHGSYASHAVFCLNALVGSIDVPGGVVYQEPPPYGPLPLDVTEQGISFRRLGDLVRNGGVEAAVGFNSNLIMSVPSTAKWNADLRNLPYYVHIGPAMNEMAAYADIILPSCTYLEQWGYESALPGSGYAEARVKQPVVESLYDSREIARILFDLADEMGPPVSSPFRAIWDRADGFAEAFVKQRTGPFISWDEFKRDGVWVGGDYQYAKYGEIFHTPSGKFEFKSTHLERLLNVRLPGEDRERPFMLAIYRPVLEIRSGTQNCPWAQEMFLVMDGVGWNNVVEVNHETARHLGIGDGDAVVIESESGEIEAEAKVRQGIIPGAAAMATGQGRRASGRWADGIGVNPNEVVGTEYDEESGQPSYFSTRVKIRRA